MWNCVILARVLYSSEIMFVISTAQCHFADSIQKDPVASKRRGRHDDRADEASRQRRSAWSVGLASDDAKAVGAFSSGVYSRRGVSGRQGAAAALSAAVGVSGT